MAKISADPSVKTERIGFALGYLEKAIDNMNYLLNFPYDFLPKEFNISQYLKSMEFDQKALEKENSLIYFESKKFEVPNLKPTTLIEVTEFRLPDISQKLELCSEQQKVPQKVATIKIKEESNAPCLLKEESFSNHQDYQPSSSCVMLKTLKQSKSFDSQKILCSKSYIEGNNNKKDADRNNMTSMAIPNHIPIPGRWTPAKMNDSSISFSLFASPKVKNSKVDPIECSNENNKTKTTKQESLFGLFD